jgi:hypothetical protein
MRFKHSTICSLPYSAAVISRVMMTAVGLLSVACAHHLLGGLRL